MLAALALPGCVFFDLSHDPCLDPQPTPECLTQGGGNSGGDAGAGAALGVAGESAEVGGTSGARVSGGSPGNGGAGGEGADDGGGAATTGGVTSSPTGGSGGESGGQSGGSSPGGTAPFPVGINELLLSGNRFVEIYHQGGEPVSGAPLLLYTGNPDLNAETRCLLPATEPGELVLIVPSVGGSCSSIQGACSTCPIELQPSSSTLVVYLRDSFGNELQSVAVPPEGEPGAPSAAQSWAAIPDGSDFFGARKPTPGAMNSP